MNGRCKIFVLRGPLVLAVFGYDRYRSVINLWKASDPVKPLT